MTVISGAAAVLCAISLGAAPQAPHHDQSADVTFLQPFGVSVRRVGLALEQLGEPLAAQERKELEAALASSDPRDALTRATAVLDRRVLAVVTINPEARVSVRAGAAPPALVEAGTRVFLVKVVNQAPKSLRVPKPL